MEEVIPDMFYLNGTTSGSSPLSVDNTEFGRVTHSVFTNIWGWTLYNNGLVINYPIDLN